MDTVIEIAKLLLDIKAVTLNLKQPYRYASGLLSPIYCDNRLIISHPLKRKLIIKGFLCLIENNQLKFDVIAGVATAGIAHAAWIASYFDLPLVYVRPTAKAHGKQNKIEGKLEKNKKALLVEDLISTGKSVITAGLTIREAAGKASDCVAIFSYQLPKAKEAFAQANIAYHTLCDFYTLIDVAVAERYINEEEKQAALKWNQNPEDWNPP